MNTGSVGGDAKLAAGAVGFTISGLAIFWDRQNRGGELAAGFFGTRPPVGALAVTSSCSGGISVSFASFAVCGASLLAFSAALGSAMACHTKPCGTSDSFSWGLDLRFANMRVLS